MKRLLVAALLALTLAALAAPITAHGNEPVGDRLDLFAPPATLLPGMPFHVMHGWGFGPMSEVQALGQFTFTLAVDGAPRHFDFLRVSAGNNAQARLWLYNFPEGMTGSHTFSGTFWAPCGPAVEFGIYPGPCDTPNESVGVLTVTETVDFGP